MALVALAGLVAVAGVAVRLDRMLSGHDRASSRPDLQRVLDSLVAGSAPLAPGAAAYVAGQSGTWLGTAGIADTSTGAPMPADGRFRLESVSKIYTRR